MGMDLDKWIKLKKKKVKTSQSKSVPFPMKHKQIKKAEKVK
tara:strand:+ start:2623 stop:2745 length:123 start_codon:yes stop_codon:yes gene_type:complete